jgi:GT2 family glycosyltransferase
MIGYIVALMDKEQDIYRRYSQPCLRERAAALIEVWSKGGKDDQLAPRYNRGTQMMLHIYREALDIIVFIHPDVIILDDDFEDRMAAAFATNPDLGLAGVIGATYLPGNRNWWSVEHSCLRGHIIQEYEDRPNRHMVKGLLGYHDDLLVVDGLCLAVRASLLRDGLSFDERFPNYLHTDTDICFSVIKMGFKVAVVDTLLQHRSDGKRADTIEWHENGEILYKKWKQLYVPGDPITRQDIANLVSQ